ncbi:Chaperone protein DnaJ [Chlorella vulgaris]
MAQHDLYTVLGVPPGASSDEIKAAFRKQALKHHPDTNSEAGKAGLARFHQVQEAYAVLRDAGKRAQYDGMRAAGFSPADLDSSGSSGNETPWGQPSNADFDAFVDEWWKKMSEEFSDYEERQFARERMNAERRATAAAWQWEKEQAQLNKGRAQRLKHRTENARMKRHATILRRFWPTHAGFAAGDAFFLGVFLAGAAGIALSWRTHLHELAQKQEQQREHGQPVPHDAGVAAAAAQPS